MNNISEQIRNGYHSSEVVPVHPIHSTPIYHPLQYQTTTVRIIDDADRLYTEDKRWENVDEDIRLFAFRILTKITGESYPVLRVDTDGTEAFFNIVIRPKVKIFDILGRPITVGYAYIHADYVQVVKSGFPEAK